MEIVRECAGAAKTAMRSMCCGALPKKSKEGAGHHAGDASDEDRLSDTTQRTDLLCEYCQQINFSFDEDDWMSGVRRMVEKWELGTLSRIKQSRCRFCKLLQLAYIPGNSPKGEPELATVSINWSHFGSGGRRALHPSITVPGHYYQMNAICLAAVPNLNSDDNNTPNPTCYLRPVRNANIDLQFVDACLSACSAQHGLECNLVYDEQAFPGLDFLRLIDVNRGCIVKAPLGSRYVALSYLWGGTSCCKLTTANESSLSQDGALKRLAGDLTLPRTISDAMALVRGLAGLQFLWVDALCLIQDDVKDLAAGIAVMDDVYERAWFTIIAAGGEDASFGLPGIQPGSRSATRLSHEIKPGLHLGVDTTLDSSLKRSVYNTRGWTFQEQLLSRRALFFFNDRVVFRCRQAEHSEDHADAFGCGKPEAGLFSILVEYIGMELPMLSYNIMLFYYSRRKLTNSGDALRAMEGLMRRLSNKMQCQFFQGLPTAAFDGFLLFSSTSDIFQRRSNLPSYSWAGWSGEIDYGQIGNIFSGQDQMNEWLAMKTWIIWYKRITADSTDLVWDSTREPSRPANDEEYIGYGNRQPFQHPPHVKVDASRTDPSNNILEDIQTRTLPGYPLLQFWTLAVYFRIDYQSRHATFRGWRALIGSNLSACGSIIMDGYSENEPFFQSDGPFELILLSEVPGQSEYHVMLLQWKDGIAERRGIGSIDRDFVHLSFAPGPVWKEVLLG